MKFLFASLLLMSTFIVYAQSTCETATIAQIGNNSASPTKPKTTVLTSENHYDEAGIDRQFVTVDGKTHVYLYEEANDHWFKFTAPITGRFDIKIVGDATGKHISGYGTKCSARTFKRIESHSPNENFFGIHKGETWYFRLQNTASSEPFTVSLAMRPWEEGEVRSFPFVIDEPGQQFADHEGSRYQVYEFTPQCDGELKVSSLGLTEQDTFVAIYRKCDMKPLAFNDEAEISLDANWISYSKTLNLQQASCTQSEIDGIPLKKDETVLIEWNNIMGSIAYDWRLDFSATGEEEAEKETPLNIYPNPTDGPLTVDLSEFDNTEQVKVKIIDLTGKILKIIPLDGGEKSAINIGDLKPALYIAIADTPKKRKVAKLVKK